MDESRLLEMALRDPECDEDYFELSDTDLEVVVPNMYFS